MTWLRVFYLSKCTPYWNILIQMWVWVMNSYKKTNNILDYWITNKMRSWIEFKICVFFSNAQNEHGHSNSNENPLKCKIMIKWCTNTTRQTLFLQQQQYFFPGKVSTWNISILWSEFAFSMSEHSLTRLLERGRENESQKKRDFVQKYPLSCDNCF